MFESKMNEESMIPLISLGYNLTHGIDLSTWEPNLQDKGCKGCVYFFRIALQFSIRLIVDIWSFQLVRP